MKKLEILLSTFAFRIHICLRIIFAKRKNIDNNKVLIVLPGLLGDSLVNAPAVVALARYYTEQGKSVYCVCDAAVWKLLSFVQGMEPVIYVENISLKDLTYKGIHTIEAALEKKGYETVILLTNRSSTLPLITAGISANKTYMMYLPGVKGIKKMFHLLAKHYTEVLPLDRHQSLHRQGEFFLNQIGISNYKARIAPIPKRFELHFFSERYITVALDSSCTERRWPPERFIELVQRILDRYNCDVVLTGSNISDDEMQQYNAAFGQLSRVKNMVGETSLEEWIELLRGSQLHIGVDSGSVHVAASVGTQAICLTGVWDGHPFFPYQIEGENTDVVEPICVYRKDVDVDQLPCFDCMRYGFYGYGNAECAAQCKSGQACLCLEKITVDDVMTAIEKM